MLGVIEPETEPGEEVGAEDDVVSFSVAGVAGAPVEETAAEEEASTAEVAAGAGAGAGADEEALAEVAATAGAAAAGAVAVDALAGVLAVSFLGSEINMLSTALSNKSMEVILEKKCFAGNEECGRESGKI